MNNTNSNNENNRPDSKKRLQAVYFILLILIIVVIGYLVLSGNNLESMHTAQRVTLDTSIELQFSESDDKASPEIEKAVFAEIDRLELLFSRTLVDSEISKVNAAAGVAPVAVNKEVLFVLEEAIYYARISDGLFDPTIAPLIDLWGFLGQEFRVPESSELEKNLPLVDYTLIEIDRNRSTVYLPDNNMALELGGIAKGYIIDQALKVFREANVEHAFINAGGDIGLIGSRPDNKPWRIGIRHPREEHNIIVVLSLAGGAVVTSGDYERAFSEDGVSYHHILDPDTGFPAGKLASVTIKAETALKADALSTAVFLLGPGKGLALIESMPQVEGVLITSDIDVLVSSGLEGLAEINP